MIKNIIFDLGGVILNINYHLTANAFRALSSVDFDELYTQHEQNPLFSDFETGKIIPSEFRSRVQELLKIQITDEEFDKAWNAMLLDLPKARLEILQTLMPNFNVALFSNTNAIHLEEVYKISERDTGFATFENHFHKEYYSHTFQQRKPHKEAYLALLEENGWKAEETLFLDDTIKNINGAKEAHIHTFHVVKDISLEEILTHIQTINESQKQSTNSFFPSEKTNVKLNNQDEVAELTL